MTDEQKPTYLHRSEHQFIPPGTVCVTRHGPDSFDIHWKDYVTGQGFIITMTRRSIDALAATISEKLRQEVPIVE